MSLYAIKPWFVARLRGIEDVLVARRVHPNRLTTVAIGASALAGAAIAVAGFSGDTRILLLVPVMVLVRLSCNALDGSIARRMGTATQGGAMLNEIGDRISDAVTIGATAMVASPALAATAVASSFLASLTGVLAQTVKGARDSSGPMGKADRAALIAAASLIAAVVDDPRVFTVALILIVVGSFATAVARVARMRSSVEARDGR